MPARKNNSHADVDHMLARNERGIDEWQKFSEIIEYEKHNPPQTRDPRAPYLPEEKDLAVSAIKALSQYEMTAKEKEQAGFPHTALLSVFKQKEHEYGNDKPLSLQEVTDEQMNALNGMPDPEVEHFVVVMGYDNKQIGAPIPLEEYEDMHHSDSILKALNEGRMSMTDPSVPNALLVQVEDGMLRGEDTYTGYLKIEPEDWAMHISIFVNIQPPSEYEYVYDGEKVVPVEPDKVQEQESVRENTRDDRDMGMERGFGPIDWGSD